MIGAVKEELCTAGDGAKLADHQFIVVNRVVIKHVVVLKQRWVISEIIVHGILAYHNIRILDCIF